MQLRIRAQHVELPVDVRIAIERKVRLVLGRHTGRIDRAQVTLSAGGAGSPPHRCRIRIRLQEGQSFALEDHAEDPLSAAGAAAWRIEHRLERLRAIGPARADARRRGSLR